LYTTVETRYKDYRIIPVTYFLPSLGLKKLVNLLILLVLTFFKLSTPLDPGAAFRFTPALIAASDFD
jgi:hypothetical protein